MSRFIETHLRRLPILERLPDEQIDRVVAAVQVLRFEPGTLVFREGLPAQGLFYFVSGRGALTRLTSDPYQPHMPPTEQIVGYVSENEYVGENSLFREMLETQSLRIVESSVVLFLSRQRLAALLMAQPELRANFGPRTTPQPQTLAPNPLFKGQRADEVVLQQFRRHAWSFIRYTWIPLFLLGAVIAIAYALSAPFILSLAMVGLGVVLSGVVFYLVYLEWQDDCIVVTDQRVVRVNTSVTTFQNSISEIPLERVLEVSIDLPPGDIFARVFNYGTVLVRTPGNQGNIALSMVPNPERLRDIVFANRERYQQRIAQQNRAMIEQQIDRVIGADAGAAPGTQAVQPSPADSYRPPAPLAMRYVNREGETVYRRHWTVWLSKVTPALIVLMISAVLALGSLLNALPFVALIGAFAVGLVGVLWLYLADWDWRNDLYILGDEIITLIHRRPLWLQNEIDQVRLNQVDSVVSDMQGLFNSLLNRGMVRISLVGSDEAKLLTMMHRPQEIQAEISTRQSQLRSATQRGEFERQREAFAEYLSAYHNRVGSTGTTPVAPPGFGAAPTNTPPGWGNAPAQTPPSAPPPRARDASPPATPTVPVQPLRDGTRPPRVPRTRPDNLPR